MKKVTDMRKNKIGLNKALENDGNFLSFLGEAARSDEYRRLKETQAKARKVHPAREMLYDYVLGWLNEADTVKIRKHISFCGECADEVLRITRIEDALTAKSVDWANKILWRTFSWKPQWAGVFVTASEIPEQNHCFKMDKGEIEISCYWGSKSGNNPAYLHLSWNADILITEPIRLLARFVNPETNEIRSEVELSTCSEGDGCLKGEAGFTSDRLGFDPSTEKWAIAIIFEAE